MSDKAGNPNMKPGNSLGISGRWKPGQSGNPKGRPLSRPFRDALDRQLAALALQKGINPDQADDIIAAAMLAKCMTGDMAAIKEFADRRDGKVPNPVGGSDELPPITAFSWREPDAIFAEPTPEAIKDDTQTDD